MEDKLKSKYNIIFSGYCSNVVIQFERNTKIKYIIEEYFKRIKKQNLLLKNFDNIYFISNSRKLDDNKEKTMEEIYNNIISNIYNVYVMNGRENDYNYKIIRTIKDNVYTTVYEAIKIKQDENENDPEPDLHVAIKLIKIERLKEDIRENKVSNEVTEEDVKSLIDKFNRELDNMQICECDNSVKIYDYYYKTEGKEKEDKKEEKKEEKSEGKKIKKKLKKLEDKQKEKKEEEKEKSIKLSELEEKGFIIIMELCDETLYHELCDIKSDNRGFNSDQIREILKQLNIVFKKMNDNKVVHRDIKLNNILIKYLDSKKKKFKVLLSDYGISNRILSFTGRLSTHAGNLLIMAPEILKMEDYNEKCDLWSLGVNIYQLYTKKYPYFARFEMGILKEIKTKKQSVLDIIPKKDALLKDLLSKLLVEDPEKRISWEEYFAHPFFEDNK